jgi:hypothetical protein
MKRNLQNPNFKIQETFGNGNFKAQVRQTIIANAGPIP